MITIRQFATDAPVTNEQLRMLDEAVVRKLRQTTVARRVANYSPPRGFGMQRAEWDELSEMGAAKRSLQSSTEYDRVNLTRVGADVPILWKDFRLDARNLESSRRSGESLDTTNAEAASHQVAVSEDELVLIGDSSLGIKGLYDAAGVEYTTASHWDTVANVSKSLIAASKLLRQKRARPPYQLIVSSDNVPEATEEKSAGAGISALQFALENILKGGTIEESDTLATGTALLTTAPGQRHFWVELGEDIRTIAETDAKGNLMGTVRETLTPRINDKNAICRLTDIGD